MVERGSGCGVGLLFCKKNKGSKLPLRCEIVIILIKLQLALGFKIDGGLHLFFYFLCEIISKILKSQVVFLKERELR